MCVWALQVLAGVAGPEALRAFTQATPQTFGRRARNKKTHEKLARDMDQGTHQTPCSGEAQGCPQKRALVRSTSSSRNAQHCTAHQHHRNPAKTARTQPKMQGRGPQDGDQMLALACCTHARHGQQRLARAGPRHTAVSENAKAPRVTIGTLLQRVGYRSACIYHPVKPPLAPHACFLRPRRHTRHGAFAGLHLYLQACPHLSARAFQGRLRGGVRALFQTNATSLMV